jgi:hypothetical protein
MCEWCRSYLYSMGWAAPSFPSTTTTTPPFDRSTPLRYFAALPNVQRCICAFTYHVMRFISSSAAHRLPTLCHTADPNICCLPPGCLEYMAPTRISSPAVLDKVQLRWTLSPQSTVNCRESSGYQTINDVDSWDCFHLSVLQKTMLIELLSRDVLPNPRSNLREIDLTEL